MSANGSGAPIARRLRWSALDDAGRRRVLERPVQDVADDVRATVAALV